MKVDAGAVVLESPELARFVVGVDIGAVQLGQAIAVVDAATGDGARFGVRVLHCWRQDRCLSMRQVGTDDVVAFFDAPAVVAAALHADHHLPELPTDVSYPQRSAYRIECDLPRIAVTEGPDLWAGLFERDQRIVIRYPVGAVFVGVVDVNAQDRAEEVAVVLASVESVWWKWRRCVACRNIEVAVVRPKLEAAAVVAADLPVDKVRLRLGAAARDATRVELDLETRDTRSLLDWVLPVRRGAQEHVLGVREAWMERDAVDCAGARNGLVGLDENVGL